MKTTFKLVVIFAFICTIMTSCSEDEECLVLADIISGTWESSILGEGDFTFQADGTLIDDNDLLIGGSGYDGQPFTDKTWVLNDSNELTLRAQKDAEFVEGVFDVSNFDCDEITLDFIGIPILLVRQ